MRRYPKFLAVAVFLLSACATEGRDPVSGQAAPSALPSPSLSVVDLKGYSAPDFIKGAVGVWTTKKFFIVYEAADESSASSQLKAWNPNRQRLRLLVLEAREEPDGTGWFQVLLSERPNGSTGWIRSDPETLRLNQLRYRIEVDLSDYELEYYRDGELQERFTVAVGQDRYPTPTGTFYVWASVPQPDEAGPYGRFALGLSGFSPVLSDWPGGGRSAIHGTADPTDPGTKVSHGCVRVFNDDMRKLEKLPMGTPVLISE